MARNGVGGYARITPGTPYVGGTTIDQTVVNAEMDDLGNEIANSIAKDGQTTPTASLPMGGFKHTGVGNGSARNHYGAIGQIQDGAFSTGTVGGTGDAITLTCAPAPAAYAAGQRFSIVAGAANTGAATINVNGLGAKAIKRDVSVALQAGDITLGGVALLEYDGTNFQLLNPRTVVKAADGDNSSLPASTAFVQTAITAAPGVKSVFSNLAITTTGASASVTVACDELTVKSTGNLYVTLRSVSLSINTAGSGAGGLDTGALAGSTWYSVWVIYNGTTTSGLISTSATAPTMPGGYTHKARIGWIRTDGTANKYPLGIKQVGKVAQYVVAAATNVTAYPSMASTSTGTNSATVSTLAAISVSTFVPSTASSIRMSYFLYAAAEDALSINPNNSVNAGTRSKTNQAQVTCGCNQNANGGTVDMILESTNIYYQGSNNACLNCVGWTDSL